MSDFPSFNRHKREVYLFGEVDDEMVHVCWSAFHAMNGTSPITVYISSDGGDVDAGLSIHDIIAASPARVRCHVIDKCYSSAVAILQAGDERTANPTAHVMIHHGTAAYGSTPPMELEYTVKFDQNQAKRYDEILLKQIRLVKKRFTKEQYKSLNDRGEYLTVAKAQSLGLLDV